MRRFVVTTLAIVATTVLAAKVTDAQAQRGLCGGPGSPGCFDPASGKTGLDARVRQRGMIVSEPLDSCTGRHQACIAGYASRGYEAKGRRDCGAARAVCMRTGVWNTRIYGPNGSVVAGLQKR